MIILGLTGKNGSGKGIVSAYFKKKNFVYYSLSDVIRDEIRKQGLEVTRENLIFMGRKLRAEQGPSILADLVLKKIPKDKNVVIDSIRNPAEVQALKKEKNFILLAIDADQKLRFERCKNRGRENDPKDLKTFIALEEKELKSKDPASQQLLKTASMADFTVMNNSSPQECYAQIEDILKNISKSF